MTGGGNGTPGSVGEPLVPGTVEVSSDGDLVRIELVGEHDLGTHGDVEPELHGATLGDGGVIADLSRTTFLDSTILHLLVQADAALRERGRRLVLVVPEGCVAHRTLEISGLSETMTWCESAARAAELA